MVARDGKPHAHSPVVQVSQPELRTGIAKFCGFLHPDRGFHWIRRLALTAGIHDSEIKMRQRMILTGGPQIPLFRQSVIRHLPFPIGML